MQRSLTPQRQALQHDSRGISLLLVVIIIGSALLIISSGALMVGLSQQEGGYALSRGGEVRSLADGCMDEVYLRIRRDASWGLYGSIPFTASNGSCTILVTDLGGGSRRIDVTAVVASYTSHIRSTYSIAASPPTIVSWEERSD